ncbi:MAG TPA: type II toxin-antitoxin system HicB family antitoxin [Dongiaceae bacterium]|nr:type II toxin-antitoxin system HicB family antitoxin [Dongiaceae bacterium]
MHYIALLIPSSVGEWRVVFPDVPECQAHGYTVDDATFAATTALSRCLAENGHLPPLPRDLTEIERDEEWLSRNNVDLRVAIVTMISLTHSTAA